MTRVLVVEDEESYSEALSYMLRKEGFEVAVAAEDAEMLPAYDDTIEDDEVIRVGDLRIRCIHTPGHTPGSTSFLIEDTPLLLTGDTLFPGGEIGRAHV